MNSLFSVLLLGLLLSVCTASGSPEESAGYQAFGRIAAIAPKEDEAASREYLRFLPADMMSMSMDTDSPSPTPPPTSPPPTPPPTSCPLTDGTTFTFDSYIMEADLIFDDIYTHHRFSITVKCDCNGKAVNGGTVGPTKVKNLFDESVVDGPMVQVINNKDLQVDWEGSALEGDAPGWTIVATGVGLCFTPAAKAGVCIVVAGLATEVFDDEILWGYRRSATFTCVESGDSFDVEMTELGPPQQETFKTNDSEYYTEFTSGSAAGAGVAAPLNEQVSPEAAAEGTTSSARIVTRPLIGLSLFVGSGIMLLAIAVM